MIRQELTKAIEAALVQAKLPLISFTLEHPSELKNGDYATNVALVLAKQTERNPKETAELIKSALMEQGYAYIEKVEVAGPGFINFHLARSFFAESITKIIGEDAAWGRVSSYEGTLVMMEYTSPNLFKPLHIGNLVGNILGESIARLFEFSGASVKRINYPSDIGLTVAKGVWSLKKNALNPSDITELGKAYVEGNRAYETDPLAKKEIEAVNVALYGDSDPELSELRRVGIETSRRHLGTLCAKLGTTFDSEFFESESGPLGKELVTAKVDEVFEKSEGAVVYRGENEGLHTRVFLNSQGLPTYEAKEVGLFELKRKAYPKFDISITVTGGEQREFFAVVFAAIRKVFGKAAHGKELKHIANGFLRLTTGKMSSRKGNVITGESVIADVEGAAREKMKETRSLDENLATAVAVGAIKYSVLRQGTGRDIIFDVEKSLSLEGDSGPYLQYAHTRAVSVMRKAEEAKLEADGGEAPTETYEVERLLYRFPEVVGRASKEHEPHYLTTYLTQVAGAFNSFYAKERIVDDKKFGAYKLALTEAFANTMRNGLWLLGIAAPERM